MCNNRCNQCENTCDPCRKQPKIYYCGGDISCAGVIRGEEISRAIKKLGDKLCQIVNTQNPLTYVNIEEATGEQCAGGGLVFQILQVGTDNLVSEHILCNDGEDFQFSEDILCGEDVVVSEGENIQDGVGHVVSYFCDRLDNINLNLIIDTTYSELQDLIENSNLEKGKFYHNADNGVILQALETNVISTTGTRVMRIVKNLYYTHDTGILGVWNAILTPTIGDVVVWGGKVWKNTTGNVGTFTDNTALDTTDWVLIPTTNDTYYFTKSFGCTYDIVNDWVSSQWDDRGNVFTYDWYTNQNGEVFGYNPLDYSDWGNKNIFKNQVFFILNNKNIQIYGNRNLGGIYRNVNDIYIYDNDNIGSIYDNTNPGPITRNRNNGPIHSNSNQGGIHYNTNIDAINFNSNGGAISSNSNGGIISNNSNTSDILSNSNRGAISNIGSTTTDIIYNTNNGDIVTTVVGVITDPVVNK